MSRQQVSTFEDDNIIPINDSHIAPRNQKVIKPKVKVIEAPTIAAQLQMTQVDSPQQMANSFHTNQT